eukprot:274779_1
MVSFCFPFNTDVVVCLICITACSGPGCLIRVALVELMGDEFILIPSLVPNLFGCFIIGFHEGFAQSCSDKYAKEGISTGLAGSITTFSSFTFETNTLIISRNPDVGTYLAAIICTFIGGILLYLLGEFVALFLFPKTMDKQSSKNEPKHSENKVITSEIEMQSVEAETRSLNPKSEEELEDEKEEQKHDEARRYHLKYDYDIVLMWILVFVVMYATIIPLSFLINDFLWESLLMSPFGALTRWYLGKVLNGYTPIPIGTWTANVVGSVLFAILYVLSWDRGDVLWKYHELGMAALVTGFCGCLTTVSSFVHEKIKLKRDAVVRRK